MVSLLLVATVLIKHAIKCDTQYEEEEVSFHEVHLTRH